MNRFVSRSFGVVIGLAVFLAGSTAWCQTTGKKDSPPKDKGKTAAPKRPQFPTNRDAAVVAVTREVLKQIYAGRVDPALMTPAMRAKYPPAKIKSLRNDLRRFGTLKTVKLVGRKAGETGDVATLKILLGDTMFIGTMTITADNRMDTFLLLEE